MKKEFVERLNGRGWWMKELDEDTVEIFAIWEYDSYEKIEANVRSDDDHLKNVQDWYRKNGGKEYIGKYYIKEVKNEYIDSII